MVAPTRFDAVKDMLRNALAPLTPGRDMTPQQVTAALLTNSMAQTAALFVICEELERLGKVPKHATVQ